LLRQHVGGDLAPGRRHLNILASEDDGAVRVADLAHGLPELDPRIGILAFGCVAPRDPHRCLLQRWAYHIVNGGKPIPFAPSPFGGRADDGPGPAGAPHETIGEVSRNANLELDATR